MKLEELPDRLRKAFAKGIKEITDKRNMHHYGLLILEGTEDFAGIKKHARLGKGVKDGKSEKLDGHSEKYKKQREWYQKNGKMSKATTFKKSNATLTGKLLDDGLKVEASKAKFKIIPKSDLDKLKLIHVHKYKGKILAIRDTQKNFLRKEINKDLRNIVKKEILG